MGLLNNERQYQVNRITKYTDKPTLRGVITLVNLVICWSTVLPWVMIVLIEASMVEYKKIIQVYHDVIKWKHFLRYWSFARGIHRSLVNSPHKGRWRGALMFSLIFLCFLWSWTNGSTNNRDAGEFETPLHSLWRHRNVNKLHLINQSTHWTYHDVPEPIGISLQAHPDPFLTRCGMFTWYWITIRHTLYWLKLKWVRDRCDKIWWSHPAQHIHSLSVHALIAQWTPAPTFIYYLFLYLLFIHLFIIIYFLSINLSSIIYLFIFYFVLMWLTTANHQ